MSLRKSQRKGGAAVRTQSPGSSLCAAPPEGDGDRTLNPVTNIASAGETTEKAGNWSCTASFLTRRGPPPVTPNLCVLGEISFRL